jgi:hypothetical protein
MWVAFVIGLLHATLLTLFCVLRDSALNLSETRLLSTLSSVANSCWGSRAVLTLTKRLKKMRPLRSDKIVEATVNPVPRKERDAIRRIANERRLIPRVASLPTPRISDLWASRPESNAENLARKRSEALAAHRANLAEASWLNKRSLSKNISRRFDK